jgi:hypothetical protein
VLGRRDGLREGEEPCRTSEQGTICPPSPVASTAARPWRRAVGLTPGSGHPPRPRTSRS